jgi:DNA-dependent protein kinase catalytic subunit
LARTGVFDFINNYVKQVDRKIADYALEIKKWCLNIFRRDQSNTVKQATFAPIIRIIEMDLNGIVDEETLEVRQLFDIYMRDFMKSTSGGTTVKGKILHTLGVLSEHFPGVVSPKSKQLLQIYMDTLKAQSMKAEPDNQLISCTFIGLSSFLNNFGSSLNEDTTTTNRLKELYTYMVKALEHTNATRHVISKSALHLLENHAFLFREYLTVDSEKMYDRMKALCSHRNDKVRKAAFPALNSFLSHVSYELVKGKRSIEHNQRTFGILLEQFSKMLDSKSGSKYYLSMAICSYGCFAAPMKKYLGQIDTKFILMKLLKFSDQMLTRSQEELEESISHLPSFLNSFANIILELEVVDTWIIDHLERIIGVFFLVLPKQLLFPKYKYANYVALMRLFLALYLKSNSLDQLLSRIVFQGLTLSISNANALDAAAVVDENNQNQEQTSMALYDQYMELWYNLLNVKNIQLSKWSYPWTELELPVDLQQHMLSIVYDKIMQAVLDMISKLDLRCRVIAPADDLSTTITSTIVDEDSTWFDTQANIKPVNSKDFELYLNLVEFTKKFLRKCQSKHFQRWVYVFCKSLIDKAIKYQYVSGFYKMLTVAMKICEEYDYFDGISQVTQTYDHSMIHHDDESTTNLKKLFETDMKTKITCFHMLFKFCKETIHRIHEFKGDLQASCIRFVLSMPRQFISETELFVSPLVTAFELGLSFLPLASVGISALEFYLKVLPRQSLVTVLPKVLPCVSEYLIVKGAEQIEDETSSSTAIQKLKQQSKTRIRSVEQSEEHKRKRQEASKLFKDAETTPLRTIQLRIIRLLGKLGGESSMILKDDETQNREVIAWDIKERIQFSLPFRDVKPEIYYDSILPRVVELAEKSSDRQTKIASCEFLHSIVLYMIGRNAYSPQARQRAQAQQRMKQESEQEQQQQQQQQQVENKSEPMSDPTPFFNIYERIFPSLLRLAVDTEVVTQQLFEPLMYQLTHWFTQNMQYENRETMALLDTIIEGLSNPKDGALRELCANLLNEFLKWSVKHDRDSKYHNIKSLFRRLYSYAHHPNVHKRLGAILAFNRMYRSFREVEPLVDQHVFDWLYNVMTSLRISNQTDDVGGIIDHTKELLQHIQKIIVFKSKILQEPKSSRGIHTSLEECVEWIFRQCSSSELQCRKQAMILFPSLCMILDGFNTEDGPKRWIHRLIKQKGLVSINGNLERNLLEVEEQLDKEERRKTKSDTSSIYNRMIFWMSNLEAYLDYVLWLFEHQLLYPHQLFTSAATTTTTTSEEETEEENRAKRRKLSDNTEEPIASSAQKDPQTLFKHLYKFIKECSLKKANQIVAVTGAEEEKLRVKKCTATIKAIDFMVLMTEKFSDTLLKQEYKIIMTNFFGLLFASVLNPERLGFNTTDEKVQTVFPKQIKRVLYALLHDKKLVSQGYNKNMTDTLKKLLNSDGKMNLSKFSFSEENQTSMMMNMDDATFLFRGYRLLHMLNILDGNMSMTSVQLSVKMGTMIFDYEHTLSPVQIQIGRELWNLCFEFGFPPKLLIKFLLDDTVWSKDDLLSQKLSQIESGGSAAMDIDQGGSAGSNMVKLAKKGEVFYRNFKTEINEYIYKRIESFAKELIVQALATSNNNSNNIVFEILLNLCTMVSRKKLDAKNMVHHILQSISPIVQHALTDQSREGFDFKVNTLKLIENLLVLDSTSLSSDISSMLLSIVLFALQSKRDAANPAIDLKIYGLRLIPLLLQSQLSPQDKQSILQQIKMIIINEFPLSYTELQPNTAQYDDHMAMLTEIMSVLQRSGSAEIMDQIMPIFRWKDHPLKSSMTQSLKRFFTVVSNDTLLECGNTILKTFFNEALPIDIRQNVIQWIGMLCIQSMPERIFTQFLESNIKRIVNSITKTITFDETVMNEDDLRAAYVTKTCCMNLVEVMYRLLPASVVKDSINKVYCDNKDGLNGKELTEKVMRAAYAARSYIPPQDESRILGHTLLLEYHSAAYNALAGAVKCTQTQEKFYTGFLFKEKNNDLWDNIVDLNVKYEFPVETNFKMYQKAVEQLRIDTEKTSNSEASNRSNNSGGRRMRYLSSLYLSDSSLSSDIPYIGSFFVPGSRYATSGPSSNSNNNSEDTGDNKEQQQQQQQQNTTNSDSEDALELDQVNSNQCMTTVLRTIEYLTSTFKAPDQNVMPSWMQEIHKKLDDDDTHPNARIFLAKIIVNRPSIFEPYASTLFAPLVKLATSKDNGGSGIHYFLRDIIVLLLRWKDMMPPDTFEGRQIASSLVAHLMKHCAHQKRSVLRSNLEMLKLLVEKWKSRIVIQKNIILGWICYDPKSNQAKLARTTGLQLLGVLLANDIPAYDPELDSTTVAEQKFYEKVLENLQFHMKEVYEASAEVSGMILNQLSTTNTKGENIEKSLEMFETLLIGNLNGFLQNKQYDRFLNCLNKIGIHSTRFLDHFLPKKVIDIMPHLFGVYKKIALQIISWRAESIPELYTSLKPYIKSSLQHHEEPTQLLLLQIIFKLLRGMEHEEVLHFVTIIQTDLHSNDEIFHSIFSESCREMYYDILIWVFDNKEGFKKEDIIRLELLKGLCDKSDIVRKKVLDFWDQESRLSVESLKRLEQVFTLLYSQNLGENWLRNASYLLLQLVHRSPDFEDSKAIFSESLSNCDFKEYQIDVSWQSRSLPMTPLFSSSAATQHIPSTYASLPQSFTSTYNPEEALLQAANNNNNSGGGGGSTGMVKATMTAQFSLTQYGQSIKEVLSDPSLSQTSLLFTPFKRANATTQQQETGYSTSSASQSQLPVPFKRRFKALKATQEVSNFAKRNLRLQKEKTAWEARHKIQRKNKVTMYRKYRTGELPDIQIAIKELVLPLQALCLNDLTVSKSVFVSLFSALYPAISEKLSEKEANVTLSNIKRQVRNIMSQSKECSLLISSMLSLCLKYSNLITTNNENTMTITPRLIREASLQSYNVELGVLVLEQYISNRFLQKQEQEEEEEENAEEVQARIEAWVELGKLYKSLRDDDVLRSIFENNVSEQTVTQKGLESELSGEYNEATKLYNDALKEYQSSGGWKRTEQTPFKQEVDFWRERQMECLRKLNMWDKLSESIKREVKSNSSDTIWNVKNSDVLLPFYIESQLKLSSEQSNNSNPITQEFYHFIDESMSVQKYRSVLESRFSGELASFSIINNQNEKAKSHVIDAYGQFIVDWSSLSSLAKTGRQSQLQKLQRLVEIEEYVHFLNLPATQKYNGFLKLITSWKNRMPSITMDDIQVWDDVVSNRDKLFDSVLKHMESILSTTHTDVGTSSAMEIDNIVLPSIGGTMSSYDLVDSLSIVSTTSINDKPDRESVTRIINEERSRTFLQAAKAARKQLYTTAAQKYLKASKASNSDNEEFGYSFFSSLVKLMRMKGRKHKDYINKYDTTINFFKTHEAKYDSDSSSTNPIIQSKFVTLLADTFNEYAGALSEHNQQKSERFGTLPQIQDKALNLYIKAAQIASDHSQTMGQDKTANAFMKLGEYCDNLLKQNELSSTTTTTTKSDAELAECVTTNFLRAMKHNSTSANTRFAKLLELIEKYPTTRSIFTTYTTSSSIPSWMFIPWISQIVSHLNGPEATCILPILDSIAEQYPQALFYAMNISRSDIQTTDQTVLHQLSQVEYKLKNPMLKTFVESLRDLDHPELRWKAWTDEIKACYRSHASDKKTLQKELKQLWAQTFDDLFDVNKAYLGVYNKRFAKNWSPYMKQDFGGRDASKLLQMDSKTFDQKATKKLMEMRKTKGALVPGKSKLNYFSAWLADFYASADNTLNYIHIPGQYHQSSAIDLEQLVKIVSFDPSILVMGSMRKPKRIKIHGSNEKDYMFLVKGGEDLRQDQRIEQLFEVMNNIMRQDPACCKRNLSLKLYKVIPMAKDVGIIEWVENTKPLKAIIEEELGKHASSAEVLRHPTTMMHMKMLASCVPKDQNLAQHQQYLVMFQKAKREMIENLMHQQYKQIPPDLLKNGILTLSSSPEAFFTLRNRYAKSLAVFNTCSYLLGIGDRHLENFLLDCSDGQIVGIDFGHAFGSATEVLPVPELMPFRLTRQLLHVMHPLSASSALDTHDKMVVGGGLYKESMIHVMTAMHQNQDLLLNTMDVFIKEPLVDWLKLANKNKQQQQQQQQQPEEADSDTVVTAWYPQRKIRLAKKKLNMVNPASIFNDDVDANAALKPVLKYIKQVINGDEEYNVRAQNIGPHDTCTSVKHQVECLIDMATDPNIMGRTYIGWCAHF